ncbi:transcriptional regulator [Enterococcus plantarum]|uniref:Helix-turn-helix domain-containing protein n=1 Tax=Enterococcus plantarum TaxID=1077675 RepID=A0A2W3YY35_9ENTE|nr:helix-turn-helix domain-containing protein [Enterococcus plantarum]MBO0424272.1 helix-turn-helix domain-containing protein [Enterococcus plantarum]MBO0467637.1 helix-turn-helix domain-containing protein [Enterococcus plantarum]OEG20082.1 transcriptional regulator [Enterococcus plantarum]PZL69860.1 helix-turn-helix domain-containing protein [Enterococcus plantarum]
MASVNIGKKLRDARLQRNMSLDELQQITKTQKRYLVAIEENDFDSMPGTFYVRAFIRQYASAVGLDGNELVEIYDGIDEPEDVETEIQYETLDESRTQMYDENSQTKRFMRSLPAVIFSLIGLAIAIVVFYITWQDRQAAPIIQPPASEIIRESSSEASSESSQASASSSTETSSSSSSSEPKAPTEVKFENESGVTVNMSAVNVANPGKLEFSAVTGPCWVGVYIATAANNDNGYYYQETIQPGQPKSVDIPAGTAQVVISLGASEYMEFKLDGQEANFNPNNTGIGPRNINLTLAYAQTEQSQPQ